MTACATMLNWPTAAVWIVGFTVGVAAIVVLAIAALGAKPEEGRR